ncbi:hypothetical protein Tco_0739594 [Tanacetum coccineum]
MGRYLTKTDEYVSGSGKKSTVDQSSYTSGYRKMKSLVINIRNEIVSDIEMHDKQVLPTSQLSNRMRAFLAAYPPVSLSPPITDLIITTCDFQKDLLDWNISGFDAKALFNMYITKRINDKSLELLESCKLYKVLSDTKGVWNKILEKHTRPGYTYWTKLKNEGNRLCCNAKTYEDFGGLIGVRHVRHLLRYGHAVECRSAIHTFRRYDFDALESRRVYTGVT